MKKYLSSLLLIVMLLTLLASAAFAADAGDPRLVDDGDLLTDAEEASLVELLDTVSEKYDMDVVIVTTPSCYGLSGEAYADDFYDYNNYAPDGILLMLCPEEGKRHVSTTGDCIDIFNEDALDTLIDAIIDDVDDGNYAIACRKFVKTCDEIIGDSKAFPIGLLIIAILAGCVLSFLIPMNVLKGELKTVKAKAAAADYVRQGSMQLTQSRDIFLYRNVTRTAKPKNNSSDTHTGSSGSSHGGRSF